MDTSLTDIQTATRPTRRKSLPALTMWLLATLAAIVVLLIYLQVVVVGSFFPPVAPILGLPAVIAALLIYAARWRWAPLFGVVYWTLLIPINSSHITHDLAHPEVLNIFAFAVIILALTPVGIVAGIGAAIQNYRGAAPDDKEHAERHLPGWFPAMLWSLAGLVLGAILVAAIAPVSAGPAVSEQTLASLPALGADHTRFEQTELRAKVGEIIALRLENHESQPHTFNIDELKVHVSMSPGTPSLALFRASVPGTYTFYCDVPGHRQAGMVGTLIIAP